jgi:hypothetical protein
MTISEVATIASAAATFALAYLTFKYVRATQAMVGEMQRARIDASRAYVIAYPEWTGWFMYLVVENAGTAPCEHVRVDLLDNPGPPWLTRLAKSGRLISREFLPAGAKALGMAGAVSIAPTEEEFATVAVRVTWRALDGSESSATYDLEPWPIIANRPESDLDRLVKAVEKVSRELSKSR